MGPCAHHRHQQQRKRHQAFELGFFLVTHFAPIHIYHQTALRTETFTQSSFPAQVFLHREVCAQRNFCAQTPLHTGVFTQRRKFLHTDALYKDVFVHINKGAWTFLCTEPLPQRSLAQNSFYTFFFGTEKNRHWENCTHGLHQKKYTPFFCTQKLYPEQFLPSRNFSAQKPLRTDFLNAQQLLQTDGFYTGISPHRSLTHRRVYAQHFFNTQTLLYTDAFTRKMNCTQKLVHTAHFYTQPTLHREVLFPLLDHLPFVFPLSSIYIDCNALSHCGSEHFNDSLCVQEVAIMTSKTECRVAATLPAINWDEGKNKLRQIQK